LIIFRLVGGGEVEFLVVFRLIRDKIQITDSVRKIVISRRDDEAISLAIDMCQRFGR
jgi:hypothetical protein